MLVIIANYAYSPLFTTPRDLLDEYFGLTGWANGLTSSGADTLIFQRFHSDCDIVLDETTYKFTADNQDTMPRWYQLPFRFNNLIGNFIKQSHQNQEDTIIHVNGLVFPLQIFHLRRSIGRNIPIVVQHHAERPMKGVVGLLQKICLKFADGFIFTTRYHVRQWKKVGVVREHHKIGEIMEISSKLSFEDRNSARLQSGFSGNPILIWTGNLNHNKDPITILKGFELILQKVPEARLYMAYRFAELLTDVKEMVKANDRLAKSVTLLGEIPYSEISSYYNSADFFVQGSHYEGSGIALLDAIACGVVPVVTDIPSFRLITNNGKVGALWNVGDPYAFAEALLTLLHYPIEQLSLDARLRFTNNFSFEILGKKAVDFYKLVIQDKNRSY